MTRHSIKERLSSCNPSSIHTQSGKGGYHTTHAPDRHSMFKHQKKKEVSGKVHETVLNFGLQLYLNSFQSSGTLVISPFTLLCSLLKDIRLCSKARTLRVGAEEKGKEDRRLHGAHS